MCLRLTSGCRHPKTDDADADIPDRSRMCSLLLGVYGAYGTSPASIGSADTRLGTQSKVANLEILSLIVILGVERGCPVAAQ